MANDNLVAGNWNDETGAFVLTYRGQTLEFPKEELAAQRSQAAMIEYVQSRLRMWQHVINQGAKLYFPEKESKPRPTKGELMREILEQARKRHTFKDEPHKPDYRKVFE